MKYKIDLFIYSFLKVDSNKIEKEIKYPNNTKETTNNTFLETSVLQKKGF
ncbi:hypothetical protein [Aquimarina aggregata]|nr:hypothetical protein [Aquimarina aggregata]